ncbi:hypothetical protein WN943_029017 [Citrus x changshan-huyou]
MKIPRWITNESRRCKVRIAEDWVAFEGQSDEGLKGVIVEAMKEEMDDTVSVFVDANRLRKYVIVEIVGGLIVEKVCDC